MSISDEVAGREVPTTREDWYRTLRKAFEDGAWWQKQNYPRSEDEGKRKVTWDGADVTAETRARYPIRKRVPRVVETPYGGTLRIDEHGVLWMALPADECRLPPVLTVAPDGVERLRDLLANPYEEVDE